MNFGRDTKPENFNEKLQNLKIPPKTYQAIMNTEDYETKEKLK